MEDCYKTVIETCDSFLDGGHSILHPSCKKDYLYRKVAVLLLSKMGDTNLEIAQFLRVGERTIYRDLEYCTDNFESKHFRFVYLRIMKKMYYRHRKCVREFYEN